MRVDISGSSSIMVVKYHIRILLQIWKKWQHSHCLKITQTWLALFLKEIQQTSSKSKLLHKIPVLSFHHSVWKSPKMSHLNFSIFWHFSPIFVLLKLTCLVTLFDRKLQVFKNSSKWTIFGIFNQLLSTQNVNVARFARNVEWDFFCDFQTPWDWELFSLPKSNARKGKF